MSLTDSKVWRWGIIGAGRIASDFIGAVKAVSNAQIIAIGGSNLERAQKLAQQYQIPKAYGSYSELASDPEVDLVYVATLHPLHKEASIIALKHGKPVLCEKPLAMNSLETEAIIDAAKKANVFLMEAMWTRYFPLTQQIKKLVDEGLIGKVCSVDVSLGFTADPNKPRLAAKEHGASALMDVGIYCLTMASLFLGPKAPEKVSAVGILSTDGFDEQIAIALQYPTGVATCQSSFIAPLSNAATVVGTKGRIHWTPHWCPTSFTVHLNDGTSSHYDSSTNPEFALPDAKDHIFFFRNSSGLAHEVRYMQDAVGRGLKESEHESLEESLTIMKTIDQVAKIIGFDNYTKN